MNRLFSTNPVTLVNTSAKMAFKKVTHCIFDMDGLLLDTEKIYQNIIADLLKKYNRKYPWDTRLRVMGTTEENTCRIIVNDLKLPCTVDDFLKRFREDQLKHLGKAPTMPGAERLVKHLYSKNIPICVATSSGEESVAVKTKNHMELFNLFHHKVMGSSDEEVKHGKPAPDIFLIAAKRFPEKPHSDQCLVFEDAPNGVTAATSAGMQVVMVPDPNVTDYRNATLVLKSLEEFKPEDFGLPAFEDNQ